MAERLSARAGAGEAGAGQGAQATIGAFTAITAEPALVATQQADHDFARGVDRIRSDQRDRQ